MWKSLQRFKRIEVWQNRRPDWLIGSHGERLELDFYLPQLAIAIEIQGQQHAVYTPHFHDSYEDYKSQVRRDKDKRQVCEKAGIMLLEIWSDDEIEAALSVIEKEYHRAMMIPGTIAKAYKVIYINLEALRTTRKPSQRLKSQAQIENVAAAWGISVSALMTIYEPGKIGVFKQVTKEMKKHNGPKTQYRAWAIRCAQRAGFNEQLTQLLLAVSGTNSE